MARTEPLLCELHAHTTWSDGALALPELVDLYGGAGFDVLAVTDHVVRSEDPWGRLEGRGASLPAGRAAAYFEQLAEEAERARARYDLVVIPGLELTFDDDDPCLAAHALAIGVRDYVSLDGGLDRALTEAREWGAALVGAHPYTLEGTRTATRTTARFAENAEWAASAVDHFELCNRHDFYPWVASNRLPAVATGDFHRPEHFATWKSVIPAERSEEAIVEYLRSRRPVSLALAEALPAPSRRAA
jgi:predicted metal-dependent phosphoesterase TrpH